MYFITKREGPGWDGYHTAQHSGNHIWQQPRSHTNHPTVAKEPGAGPKLIYITYYSLLCTYSFQKFEYILLLLQIDELQTH